MLDATKTKAVIKIVFSTGEALPLIVINNIARRTGLWWTISLEVEGKDVHALIKEWEGSNEVSSSNTGFLTESFDTGTSD